MSDDDQGFRKLPRVRALSEAAFQRYQRGIWAVCIGVYLVVFFGGLHSGGSELLSVGRAVAFTLVAALLGRTALGLLGASNVPGEAVPMANDDRQVGSLSNRSGPLLSPNNPMRPPRPDGRE